MAMLASSTRSLFASASLRGARPVRAFAVRANASSAKEFVNSSIADNKVVVFSKSYCPFCAKAKSALGSVMPAGSFTVHEIENRPDCEDVQDALMDITGGRSVPRVFIGGKFIGGGDDTAQLASTGELKTLLAEVGAL